MLKSKGAELKETRRIVKKILKQASNGYIIVGGWPYYVQIFVNGEGAASGRQDFHLLLNIPDYELFVEKVHTYLKVATPFYQDEQGHFELSKSELKEKLVMCLLINMTRFEGANIDDSMYKYIDMRTHMLQEMIDCGKFSIGEFDYSNGARQERAMARGAIVKNHSNLEAPYKMRFYFDNENGDRFTLPSITFGLVGDTCYVYAVQRERSINQGRIVKDLDRYLRKLNKGVDPELVIANVSPSALASLTLFVQKIKKMGAKKIVAKDFLPARYMAIIDGPRGVNKECREELNRNQFNMTNKFTWLFARFNHHFVNCEAVYQEYKGEMEMVLLDGHIIEDNIIYQLSAIGQGPEIELQGEI